MRVEERRKEQEERREEQDERVQRAEGAEEREHERRGKRKQKKDKRKKRLKKRAKFNELSTQVNDSALAINNLAEVVQKRSNEQPESQYTLLCRKLHQRQTASADEEDMTLASDRAKGPSAPFSTIQIPVNVKDISSKSSEDEVPIQR
ncbi:hypothetical protein L6452_36867 [Arctium lappa]|uniref:Uncharacterized protein n=1 Tax=Arctium lappa TaxID=4217 RepID=A0ACB8Y1D3_ARCLA|nr:hypothetical protein L6452_36867 [Arctium lappa]